MSLYLNTDSSKAAQNLELLSRGATMTEMRLKTQEMVDGAIIRMGASLFVSITYLAVGTILTLALSNPVFIEAMAGLSLLPVGVLLMVSCKYGLLRGRLKTQIKNEIENENVIFREIITDLKTCDMQRLSKVILELQIAQSTGNTMQSKKNTITLDLIKTWITKSREPYQSTIDQAQKIISLIDKINIPPVMRTKLLDACYMTTDDHKKTSQYYMWLIDPETKKYTIFPLKITNGGEDRIVVSRLMTNVDAITNLSLLAFGITQAQSEEETNKIYTEMAEYLKTTDTTKDEGVSSLVSAIKKLYFPDNSKTSEGAECEEATEKPSLTPGSLQSSNEEQSLSDLAGAPLDEMSCSATENPVDKTSKDNFAGVLSLPPFLPKDLLAQFKSAIWVE